MKKIFLMSTIIFFVLSSCSLFNEFKETKVTIVNSSDSTILVTDLDNGVSGISKVASGYSILAGEELTMPLVPILYDGSYAELSLYDYSATYKSQFTYEEGAHVVITFNPDDDDTNELADYSVQNATEFDVVVAYD